MYDKKSNSSERVQGLIYMRLIHETASRTSTSQYFSRINREGDEEVFKTRKFLGKQGSTNAQNAEICGRTACVPSVKCQVPSHIIWNIFLSVM